MFWKTLIAIIIAVVVAILSKGSVGLTIGAFVLAMFVAIVIEGVRIVPQQSAWVVERLGKFSRILEPGLQLIVPIMDRIAYRHSLKEVPLDVPEQVCITRDNTQLAVDGIIYFQVTDPRLASYGSSNYEQAVTQLAQTALRSVIGKMELDKTFESRDEINHTVVQVLDEAGRTWGIKVLRYEIKSLTPPESILRAMQAQITAEREKRAVIATSEGKRQQEINIADGQRQAAILESEGQKQAQINKAAGEAGAIELVANANANAVRVVAAAIEAQGGMSAANLKVAEKYIEAFQGLAKTNNTLIIPSNLSDIAGLVASAMTVLDRTKAGEARGEEVATLASRQGTVTFREIALPHRTAIRSVLVFACTLLLSASAGAQLFRAYLARRWPGRQPLHPGRALPPVAAAHAAVANGGEIWLLDSANYNTAPVNITKSVTILAVPGAVGSVVAAGGNAINIATPGVKVVLRNLVIVPLPAAGGSNGIVMTAGAGLTIEQCVLANLPDTASPLSGAATVRISDTTIRGNTGVGFMCPMAQAPP
jgi:regulator of protease activity HflC (stomatin/prohibitin superfamily)